MRMVCERGSSTATMRAFPTRRRRPSSVVAIAVVVVRKSSQDGTPWCLQRAAVRRAM
jgi:hypothetical protein